MKKNEDKILTGAELTTLKGKKPKRSSGMERINKSWHIPTMKYCLPTKMNDLQMDTKTWMILPDITCERNRTKEHILYGFIYIKF